MVISRGDVCWAELGELVGAAPGFRRPVVIIQGDAMNRSKIATAICVPLTSNLTWAGAPGNVLITARSSGLPRDSVANVSQIVTIDRVQLVERVGTLSKGQLFALFSGLDIVLGRTTNS